MVIFTTLLILSQKKCVILHHIYINDIFTICERCSLADKMNVNTMFFLNIV